MITSFIIMYVVMFLNMADISHYHTSATRIYMGILMVTPIAVVTMLMMGKIYPNKKLNSAIIISSILVFGIVLRALSTQTPVNDVQYMKAMIPHHSFMKSKHANIQDREVKKLSQQIMKSQEEEIAQMEAMLKRMTN